jgi:outer membrane protein OmpA-like peptidoglycan-associated protein
VKEACLSKTLLWLLGLMAFAILGYFCVYPHNHHIQADINERTAAALQQAGLNAKVQTDGRDIVLTGTVPTEEVKKRAGEIAAATWGVNSVDNRLIVEQAKVLTPVQVAAKSCQAKFNELLGGQKIEFQTDNAEINPSSHKLLDSLVAVAKECPEARIQIAGHTDNKGSAAYNQKLSERRAGSVVAYLKQKGIAAARLTAVGFGLTKPIADNNTPAGMQQNRRIEFNVEGI